MTETFKCATCGCEHSVALSTPISDPDYYTRHSAPPSREAEIAAQLSFGATFGWALARLENTKRIAFTKDGEERDGWLDDLEYWKAVVYLLAQLQQAREALKQYGQHLGEGQTLGSGCPRTGWDFNQPCTCGLDAALKAVR